MYAKNQNPTKTNLYNLNLRRFLKSHNFGKKSNFRLLSKCWSKIEILTKNKNVGQKSEISAKPPNFGQKS